MDRTRVTMEDVAARAGVSRALVSIVLRGVPGASPQSRDRVLKAVAELDYHPDHRARLLSSSRSRTVGVVYGLQHAFHAAVVEALYAAAGSWLLALEPSAPSRSEATAVKALLDYRCEAVILVGSTLAPAAVEELAGRLPVVSVARALPRLPVDTVRTDDEAGARLATRHLVDLGHHRIAYAHGGRFPGAAERRAGYRAVMKAAGLDADLVAGGLTDADGERAASEILRRAGLTDADGERAAGEILRRAGLTDADGERAAGEIPRRGGPTAVLGFNDPCAAGILAAARARGIAVPQDLSLVGYDDSAVAALSTVSLTTIRQDAAAIATAALTRAADRIDEPGAPGAQEVIAPQLVVRGTTAPPA